MTIPNLVLGWTKSCLCVRARLSGGNSHIHLQNTPDLKRSRCVDSPSISWNSPARKIKKDTDSATWNQKCYFFQVPENIAINPILGSEYFYQRCWGQGSPASSRNDQNPEKTQWTSILISVWRPLVQKWEKKTQHGVAGPENPREDLRDCAQSIGDAFYALENTPVARSTPNSLGERSD